MVSHWTPRWSWLRPPNMEDDSSIGTVLERNDFFQRSAQIWYRGQMHVIVFF